MKLMLGAQKPVGSNVTHKASLRVCGSARSIKLSARFQSKGSLKQSAQLDPILFTEFVVMVIIPLVANVRLGCRNPFLKFLRTKTIA